MQANTHLSAVVLFDKAREVSSPLDPIRTAAPSSLKVTYLLDSEDGWGSPPYLHAHGIHESGTIIFDERNDNISTRDYFLKLVTAKNRYRMSRPDGSDLDSTEAMPNLCFRETMQQAKLQIQLESLEQWGDLLVAMTETLDRIDLNMSAIAKDSPSLALDLVGWKGLLTSWRPLLGKQQMKMNETYSHFHTMYRSGDDQTKLPLSEEFDKKLRKLQRDRDIVERRMEQTSQELGTLLTMLESRTATAQTRTISLLTELAFIFIPLSFASSFFSMSIKVRIPRVHCSSRPVTCKGTR